MALLYVTQSLLYTTTTLLIMLYILWRLWRFTLVPMIRPNDPKEMPYWIPGLGHGLAFFYNSTSLLLKASKHFEHSGKAPFAITVFGSKFYVVTHPAHTTEVFKNLDSSSFEVFVEGVMKSLGLSKVGFKVAFTPLPKDKPGFPSPRGETLFGLVRKMHIYQHYPGQNLQDLEYRFSSWFQQQLHLPILQKDCRSYALGESSSSITVPLLQWCSEFFTRAGDVAYFGNAMSKIDPHFAENFEEFDELGWQIMYQYPEFLSKDLAQRRAQLLSTLKGYFQLPSDERTGSTWFVNMFEEELRMHRLTDDDKAAMLLATYWVVNTNIRKALFWMLIYILFNKRLIAIIRNETSAAFKGDVLVNPQYLQERCPYLEAIWHETLRMSANSASIRPLTQDTVIGGKLMRQGNQIIVPYRLLHFDEDVFGSDVSSFKPERFLGDEGRNLTKSSSWRPFGGGKTVCTGRYFVKHLATMFVSLLVRRLDISVVDNPEMPEANLSMPVLGIMSPKLGRQFLVKIEARGTGP